MVSALVVLLSIEILVKMLQGLHNSQQLSTSNTVVSLGFGQTFAEVGHNPFTTTLHLGYYTIHPNIADGGVDDELLPWLRVTQDRCSTQCFCSAWKAVSASVDQSNVRFYSVNLVGGLTISANPEINFLLYAHSPRKLLNWCLPSGLAQLFTASSFSGSVVTSVGEMM